MSKDAPSDLVFDSIVERLTCELLSSVEKTHKELLEEFELDDACDMIHCSILSLVMSTSINLVKENDLEKYLNCFVKDLLNDYKLSVEHKKKFTNSIRVVQ